MKFGPAHRAEKLPTRRSLILIAGLAVAMALPIPREARAQDDGIVTMAENFPEGIYSVKRIEGPSDRTTHFLLVNQTYHDRLFVRRSIDGRWPTTMEITELGKLEARVLEVRSESDVNGITAFVDVRNADWEETTYELFLDRDAPATYLFQPASN